MKYLLPFIVMLLLAGGFFMVLNQLADIRGEIQTIQLTLGLPLNSEDMIISEGEKNENISTSTNSEGQDFAGALIPTAIIFTTLSSPALQPQTNIAVIVEGVSKTEDGRVMVQFKVFTSEASSYSALLVQDVFEIVDLSSGANQRPADVKGSFASIPPKSAVSGTAEFRVSATQRSVILQVNAEGGAKFYQFDFEKRTYKETVLG